MPQNIFTTVPPDALKAPPPGQTLAAHSAAPLIYREPPRNMAVVYREWALFLLVLAGFCAGVVIVARDLLA